MFNIIDMYVSKMTKEDIIRFALKNNLNVSKHEIDFIYNFIKKNYQSVLKNPDSFSLSNYKSEFSNENYLFLESLVNKYKKVIH